jgi:hypothetical protein
MAKCLSVRQPWAQLIALGIKSVENRGEHFGPDYVGWLYIHASKLYDNDAEQWIHYNIGDEPIKALEQYLPLPLGKIIALVYCTGSKFHSNSPWFIGPKCLVFNSPSRLITPIPYRGQLGIFNIPDNIEGIKSC